MACKTPLGSPAFLNASTNFKAQSAPCVGGLNITTFPPINAGAIFEAYKLTG